MIELKEIENGITLIATEYHDVDLNLLYVVRNNESYLLDTSTSLQIKAILDKLEETPKNAIISHAHLDHAGGSGYLYAQGSNVIAHKISASLLSDIDSAVYSFFPNRYVKWIGKENSKNFIDLIIQELGEPKVTTYNLPTSTFIKCFEAFGHVAGAIVCKIGKILFTGDEVQGSGIKGRAETNSIPQISSISDYLVTIYRLIQLKPEIIIPAHNYLPSNTRIIEGSEVERFLYSSLDSTLKLLEIAGNILDKPITLGEFTEKLLREYGINRKIYPQALITAEAIINYLGKKIARIKEGDVTLYFMKQ
ncbi:MBL fold metallo-hydrolase [Sulfolobus sp. E11-6]|uniref:MBL fold metallo-hydrolase n=1 Tax=Sulfolobus sp. E11-6 TaxID=2663020 RepID=UPI0013869B8F|nr:MBL fold metallo-hydrolase [Sulfolobus sp. E11-6]